MFFSQQLEPEKWKSMVIAICYIYYSILLTKKQEHISSLCCSCGLFELHVPGVRPRILAHGNRSFDEGLIIVLEGVGVECHLIGFAFEGSPNYTPLLSIQYHKRKV